MPRLKRWIDRAREAAHTRLPEDVLDAGRRIRNSVAEHAPAPVRDAIERYVPEHAPEPESERTEPSTAATPAGDAPRSPTPKTHDQATIDDDNGPGVVVYATSAEAESVANIRAVFAKHDIHVREIDLATQPKYARQIAGDTGVFVPPYVYIGGRFWGDEFDIIAIDAEGDLVKIVEGRTDEIGETARRIGHVHESFSDALTVENIIERLRAGHILCVDDLDCWLESDSDGERLFYQGAPHPGSELERVADEISTQAESGELEAQWRFEPEVAIVG